MSYCRHIAVVLFLAAVTACAEPSSAPVVKHISVENSGHGMVDETFVKAHISSSVGAEVDRQKISRDAKSLMDTAVFSSVDVRSEATNGGVVLVYLVVRKLKLGASPVIKGCDNLSESRIRDLLDLHPNDLIDEHVLNTRAAKVADEYRREFYPDVLVTWEMTDTDKDAGQTKVTFTVDEGDEAEVESVVFIGNTAYNDSDLKDVFDPPRFYNPFSWFNDIEYSPEKLEEARIGMRDMYLDAGYLDVAVETPVVSTNAERDVTLTVNIREGISCSLGTIMLDGVTIFPEVELRKVLTLREGDIVTPKAMEKATQALRDYYGSRGYVNTSVRYVLDTTGRNAVAGKTSGVANVVFRFMEGKLVRIGNIDIRGNSRTRDKVIRREIQVYPGEVYNEVKIRRSQMVLMNLGYFEDVRTVPVATGDPEKNDLAIEVDEKQTGQVSAGVGFSSIDQITGFFSISQNNFDLFGWPYLTGGGQKLKLSAQVGESTREYVLSFEEPWFLDRKLALGVDLYTKEVDYDDYDLQKTGGSIGIRKSLPGANHVSVKYQLEQIKMTDISDTNAYYYIEPYEAVMTSNSYFFTSGNQDAIESSMTLTLTHDTRNNPFFPTRGVKASIYGSLSGGPLGFDTDIYSLGVNGIAYFPMWFGHVFSLRARYDTVENYGDTETVPLSDRLFIGGARTLRGYDYRDVGPKVVTETNEITDATGYKPVGGKSLALASAEYVIPVAGSVLKLGCFYDLGNVWLDSYELDISHLASSAGVGLRFDLPMFPIRIDRAWSIDKDNPLTDEDEWVLWIGFPY